MRGEAGAGEEGKRSESLREKGLSTRPGHLAALPAPWCALQGVHRSSGALGSPAPSRPASAPVSLECCLRPTVPKLHRTSDQAVPGNGRLFLCRGLDMVARMWCPGDPQ